MKSLIPILTGLMASFAWGQNQASTLEVLTRRSPIVFEGRLRTLSIHGNRLEAVFRVEESWKGEPGRPPVLSEPKGPHCGSALAGLKLGSLYVVFVEEEGRRFFLRGGSRGIIPLDPEVESAIKVLLRTGGMMDRVRILARSLSSRHDRIRRDAALALPLLPGLEQADPSTRMRIRSALLTEASRPRPGIELLGLLQASARTHQRTAAEVSWNLLLREDRKALHPLAEGILLREVDLPVALSAAPVRRRAGEKARLRMLGVLAGTGSPLARPLAARLLGASAGRVRKEALVTLLALGQDPEELEASLGKASVDEARALLDARRRQRRRYRAIRPR